MGRRSEDISWWVGLGKTGGVFPQDRGEEGGRINNDSNDRVSAPGGATLCLSLGSLGTPW